MTKQNQTITVNRLPAKTWNWLKMNETVIGMPRIDGSIAIKQSVAEAGRAEDGLRVGKPTENVVIRYSLAQQGHGGVTCGSETAGGVKNVYVHDCVFDGTQIGIRFKTRRNRAGGVNDALYEKIRMINVGEAFKWDLLGSKRYVGEIMILAVSPASFRTCITLQWPTSIFLFPIICRRTIGEAVRMERHWITIT